MILSVVLEQRFERTPDGTVWSRVGFPYLFWQRYLRVFDAVQVVARVREVSEVPAGLNRSDGPGVSFAAVPMYLGPGQYLARRSAVRIAVRAAVNATDAVILRVPSQLAAVLTPVLRRERRPYGVELVGDPWDVFAPGAVRHPMRPLFRWWFPRELRRQCAEAVAVAYVTRGALQARYPASTGRFTTHYSSIQLEDDAFVESARSGRSHAPFTLVTVASLEQMYKAPDVLLRAVAECVAGGLNLRLNLVGDGRHRAELEALVRALGLQGRVEFMGQLSGASAVREQLDAADLFVLPSRTEGLPRAMIEAMARGLPCIGSTVGGIPELLPPEDMVPPNDIAALARQIRSVLGDTRRQQLMSQRNLKTAGQYHDRVLAERRDGFYAAIRAAVERHLPASLARTV